MAAPPFQTDIQRLDALREFFGHKAVQLASAALMDIYRATHPPADQTPFQLENSEPVWWVADMYQRLATHFEKVDVTDECLTHRTGAKSLTPFDSKGHDHVFQFLADDRIGLEMTTNGTVLDMQVNCHLAAQKLQWVVNELLDALDRPQDLGFFADYAERVTGYCTWMSDYVTCLEAVPPRADRVY